MRKMLQDVAIALSDDCCCGHFSQGGECCMTERARGVFAAIERAGGPTLAECEAIAISRGLTQQEMRKLLSDIKREESETAKERTEQ